MRFLWVVFLQMSLNLCGSIEGVNQSESVEFCVGK